MTKLISKEAVLALHARAIERFGGAAGVRDEGALEAALAQPWQTFGGEDFYPSVQEKAARLCYEIVKQHPFVDGNKRTGTLLMGVLLRDNGIRFVPEAAKLQETIISLAASKTTYEQLLEFVRECSL